MNLNSFSITGKRAFSAFNDEETTSEEALNTDASMLPESDRSSPGTSSDQSAGEYAPLSREFLVLRSPQKSNTSRPHQGFIGSPEDAATVIASPEKAAYDSDLKSELGDEAVSILNFDAEDESAIWLIMALKARQQEP